MSASDGHNLGGHSIGGGAGHKEHEQRDWLPRRAELRQRPARLLVLPPHRGAFAAALALQQHPAPAKPISAPHQQVKVRRVGARVVVVLENVVAFFLQQPRLQRLGSVQRDVLRVLMEGTPSHIDIDKLKRAIAEVDGVVEAHHVHVWSLSSSRHALSAQIKLDQIGLWEEVLPKLQELLQRDFGVGHSTLQPETHQEASSYSADAAARY